MNVSYLLLLLIPLVMLSCRKEAKTLNQKYIPVNDCRSYTIEEETLRVCLDSVITDSRCPADVVCIWQGVSAARFITEWNGQRNVITLATEKIVGFERTVLGKWF
jgi:hypothetical protein